MSLLNSRAGHDAGMARVSRLTRWSGGRGSAAACKARRTGTTPRNNRLYLHDYSTLLRNARAAKENAWKGRRPWLASREWMSW